jgi:RNA polymerase sigma factor (sigma-70 family)
MMTHDDVPVSTFDEFFLAEFPRLVSMLTAWNGDRAVAEDLAQDALLQAHRNWATVSALDRPGTWVRRVALNRSSNEGRRRRRERAARARLHTSETAEVAIPTADDQLWARVRALPPAQRDATILRYVDDLPLADIAVVLGCSDGTVKTHLQRARRTLAAHLSSADSTDAVTDPEAPR